MSGNSVEESAPRKRKMAHLVSHTLTVPSSLAVTIHLPFAEYAKAVTLAVCPSRVATGVLLSDGMSHILRINEFPGKRTRHNHRAGREETYRTWALPAAARKSLSGLIASLLTCF